MSPCWYLKPNLVVFVGKKLSAAKDREGRPAVIYDVQERLWNMPDIKVITVLHGADTGEPRLLAVSKAKDGQYWLVANTLECGEGFAVPLDHPWARAFRRNIAERTQANVVVEVLSNYVPVSGAHFYLRGKGGVFERRTHGAVPLDPIALPPGDYQVTVEAPNFKQVAQQAVSILPGSCSNVRTTMDSTSAVSGQLLDERGEPVRHERIFLKGSARVSPRNDSLWDFVVESARDAFYPLHGRENSHTQSWPTTNLTYTDGDGRFSFKSVYPGRYFLVWGGTYYPGVPSWQVATPFIVDEGKSLTGVAFRIPSSITKRRAEIQVISEDSVPVSGATVEHEDSDVPQTTDGNGRAMFDVWTTASEYPFDASILLIHERYYGREILHADVSHPGLTIILKGLRLGKPAASARQNR